MSLADFDAKEVSIRWYNVLSFKFMQSDANVPSKKSSSSSDSSVREILLAGNRRPDSLITDGSLQVCMPAYFIRMSIWARLFKTNDGVS